MKKGRKAPENPTAAAEPLQNGCAHNWLKTEIRGRKAFRCTHCGKIIDSQD